MLGRELFWNETVVVHDSPVVRLYAENDAIPYDGIDLFVERCLQTREDGKNLEYGHRHGRLKEALERHNRSLLRQEELQDDDRRRLRKNWTLENGRAIPHFPSLHVDIAGLPFMFVEDISLGIVPFNVRRGGSTLRADLSGEEREI